MTWIRCSDRMPMGEACEVRIVLAGTETITRFSCANVATLRAEWGCFDDWIDRTEWRPLDEAPLHDEGEPATWEDETRGWEEEHGEWLRETERNAQEQAEGTLRAALRRYGLREQLAMLQEECGELVASVNRWRRGREGAFPALIEEIADVEILIDQMRLEFGAEIDAARARKLARLAERLGL